MRISYWSSYVCSSDRFADGAQAVDGAGIWMLAVKPQVLRQVCEALAPLARAQRPVLVSIAAGITSAQISRWLGGGEGPDAPAIVRCMPHPRSEERRVGKECGSTCRSRWSPHHSNKKRSIKCERC